MYTGLFLKDMKREPEKKFLWQMDSISDMKNSPKAKCKKLSEDREEMILMLLALVVMAIIVWIMLISSSVPDENRAKLVITGRAD